MLMLLKHEYHKGADKEFGLELEAERNEYSL
jgi:hypothetical protein